MGISCRITKKNGAIERVEAPNGSESMLYRDALSILGDSDKALGVMATAYTDGFKSYYGDWQSGVSRYGFDLDRNGEPKIDDVLRYMQRENCVVGEMLREDVSDLNSFASSTWASPEYIGQSLRYNLYNGGVFNASEGNLRRTGLYDEDEIAHLTSDATARETLESAIQKIPYSGEESSDKGIHFLYGEKQEFVIKTEGYNQFGKSNRLTDGEIDITLSESVGGIKDRGEFDSEINNIGNQYIVDEYENNPAFREDIYDYYSSLVLAPSFNPATGVSGSERLHSVLNFSRFNPSSFPRLRELSMEISSSGPNIENLQEKMREIESLAADFGIDISGARNLSYNEAVDLVSSLYLYARSLSSGSSDGNARWFSEQLDRVLPGGRERAVQPLPGDMRGMPAVVSHTDMSDRDMFESHSLLRVSPGIYVEVQRVGSIDEAYSSVAEAARTLPSMEYLGASGMSQDEAVQHIRKYVSSVSSTDNTPEMVLIRIAYGAPVRPSEVQVDMDYEFCKYLDGEPSLSGNERRDLYSLYLQSKIAGGENWENLFQYVGFDEEGNPYMKTDDPESLIRVEMWATGEAGRLLRALSYGSKDPVLSGMFHHPNIPSYIGEDLYLQVYRKYPHLLNEYKGGTQNLPDGAILAEGSYDPFIRMGRLVYQKIGEATGGSVYKYYDGSVAEVKRLSTESQKPTYRNPSPSNPKIEEPFCLSKKEFDNIDKYTECNR